MADSEEARYRSQWSAAQQDEFEALGRPSPYGRGISTPTLCCSWAPVYTKAYLRPVSDYSIHRPLRLGRTFLDKFIQLPNPAWREVGRPPNPRVS